MAIGQTGIFDPRDFKNMVREIAELNKKVEEQSKDAKIDNLIDLKQRRDLFGVSSRNLEEFKEARKGIKDQKDALEKLNVETRTLSAITVTQISEPFIRRRALRHLEKNRVVIVAGGTGNPYFSTDTAAALRATELKAEILLKATKVNGVFDKDPLVHDDARPYKYISYSDVMLKNLRIMDMTAITLCKENNLPIRVFDVNGKGNLKEILSGKEIGTIVSN